MSQYEFIANQFLLPSPAGAYYATSSNQKELLRGFLLALMMQPESKIITREILSTWFDSDDESPLSLLHKAQQLGWLRAHNEKSSAPNGSLEGLLPPLLAELSSTHKALLADHQGFNLASHGFTHEAAEELSALSADLSALRVRHGHLLSKNLKIKTEAMGLIDADGNSQLGFWPLHIGKHCFTLVMSGIPHFNQTGFTNLIWMLINRYASSDFSATSSIHDINSRHVYTDRRHT